MGISKPVTDKTTTPPKNNKMENKYFTRKINEGTVKRTHYCSFDSSIKLEILVEGSKKVLDYLLNSQARQFEKTDENAQKKGYELAKENFLTDLAGLRINGLPILFEDLQNCFDSEEILEVTAFVNGQDMTIFGGAKEPEKN